MSQVTEQSVRFQTALASMKLIQASAVLDLTEDEDRKSGSAGMPRPISYAVFCLKKKKKKKTKSDKTQKIKRRQTNFPHAKYATSDPDRRHTKRTTHLSHGVP